MDWCIKKRLILKYDFQNDDQIKEKSIEWYDSIAIRYKPNHRFD